ncbi:hypothetical protein GCM10022223_42610 [Kineosporia mesophila]|uniref:Uncharacterized protein n=1 Tax=Kineosporia mesophila TaxID=566012 RepID=A0ABP6ZZY5_9ACTN
MAEACEYYETLSHHLPEACITMTGDFFEAIEAVTRRAEPDDVVVYSPGVY